MTPELLDLVGARFKALADPTRLRVLNALRGGARTVGDVVAATGVSQPNVSRHLQLLLAVGLVSRRKRGLYVHYALADRDVLKLCDLMCGRIAREARATHRAVGAR